MDNICKICGKKITSRHFNTHGMTQKEYYTQFFPKVDLYTKEPIEFKTKEQYFAANFNSKINMNLWLKSVDIKEAEKYILEAFKLHKEKFNFAPSHVELRCSEYLPNLAMINKIVDYRNVTDLTELKLRFTLKELPDKKNNIKSLIIDTREQKPLKFKIKSKRDKLEYGDYASPRTKVFIERKSLNDFVSTLSAGIDRFKREIERANDDGAYLVVLIESSFKSAASFDKSYLGRFTKILPKYIFHNLKEIMQKYPNIQFFFVEDRTEASKYVVKILELGAVVSKIDLQYFYDTGLF